MTERLLQTLNAENPIHPQKPVEGPGGNLLANVMTNWAWHVLVILSGFLVPRWIAQHQGRELLGIWDLGWSLLFFVSFLKMGASGAVNRFVSRYRALEDWKALNGSINCCLVLLTASALLASAATGIVAEWLPRWFGSMDPSLLGTARIVVLLLGLAAAVEMPFAVFNSILTGHNRFDLLNAIRGAKDLGVLVAMGLLLYCGFGLVALAAAVFVGEIACGIAEIAVAFRLCPRFRISPRELSRPMFRKVLSFGGKSMTRAVARAVLYHVNSILVAVFFGPAVLAVYQRQRNLVLQAMKFVKQFAQVFIPSAGERDARNDEEGLRRLMMESGRWGMLVTAPLMFILILLGGPLVTVWMGPDYSAPGLLAVLALGHLVAISQLGPGAILEGMGRHGRPALLEVGSAIAATVVAALGCGLWGWGPIGAAAAASAAIALGSGVMATVYACRVTKLDVREYMKKAVPAPFLLSAPLVAWLLLSKNLCGDHAGQQVAVGLLGGAVVTGVTYWVWAVPAGIKLQMGRRCRLVWAPPGKRAGDATRQST